MNIDALNDIPEETALMGEVEQFIDALKAGLVPDLNQINNANKAAVGKMTCGKPLEKKMNPVDIL